VQLATSESAASNPNGDQDEDDSEQADQQIEDIWAAEVIERTADRTINDVSAVDAMATGLLAVQAAIYAILLDKRSDFAGPITIIFLIAIVLAATNLFLLRGRNVPNPEVFYEAARNDASTARRDLIAAFLSATEANERLLRRKRIVFWTALVLSVSGAAIASWFGRPGDVAPAPVPNGMMPA